MKKLSSSLLSCISICILLLAGFQAKANRAAAGEVGYAFIRTDSTISKIDSTVLRVDTTKSPTGAVTKLDTVYRYDTAYNYADVYKLTYKFYNDCGGATGEPSSVQLCYSNSCTSFKGFVTLAKKTPLGSNGLPLVYSCAGVSTTTCNGGTIRGFKEWIYEGQVSLPSRCASWRLQVSIASRNATITNYATPAVSNNLFSETTLNNLDATNSSSPVFSLAPIQYMCNNTKQDYAFTATDPDGDVLTYSLIDPATATDNQTTCPTAPGVVSYVFGGTYPGTSLTSNPFPTTGSFMMSSSTGEMSFTPSATGDQLAQLCMLVTKTRGTKVVGTMMRDMQFVISNSCAAGSPVVFTQNPVSGVLPVAPDTNLVCPNKPHQICFDLTSADPGTSIFVSSDNHLTFSKTASTSVMSAYTGQNTNSVNACFSWTPDTVDEGTKYLVINSTICKPGQPKLYRKDTIKIFTAYTVHASKDDTICIYESTELCVVGGGIDSFAWAITTGGGITTGTLGIATPNDFPCTFVTPGATTTYLVTCKDRYNGCKRADLPALNTNQDEVKVVLVNPKIDAGPDTTMCVYSTLQLNANLSNRQPELSYAFRWTPSTYMDDSTIINPTLKIPAGTKVEDIPDSIVYYIDVIPSLTRCGRQDTVTVYFLKGFYILTGDSLGDYTGLGYQGRQRGFSDTAICAGQSVRMVGWVHSIRNRVKYDLTWTPSTGVSTPNAFATGMTITPTATTTYTLTAQKGGCPDSSKKVTIEVQPIPTVDIGPDKTVCFGDTIDLVGTITPSPDVVPAGYYTYAWTPGGAIAKPDTFITYFAGFVTQELTLTVKSPAGCTGTDKAMYKVEVRDFLSAHPTDTVICPGDKIQLHAVGDALLDYVIWRPAGTVDTPSSLNPIVSPEYTTDYIVKGTDINHCVDSEIIRVTVLPRAVIYMEDSVTIYPGDVYQMNPEGNGLYYTWFPAIGLDDANISNPKASPVLNTTYYITAKTDAGCTAYDSVYVFVAPDSYIDIPNAFVPGNAENSKFRILHLGEAKLTSFKIFNRWGNKVFETTNIDEGWDGAYGGQPQPLGVYVYVIEGVTAKGKKVMKQGNVTLIR